LTWTSQDPSAGAGTVYDLASGLVGDLRLSGGFAGAACVANDVADTPYDDTRAGPSSGSGYYYLVRAQNACGAGGYGLRSNGAPRIVTVCP
jgi:hypothetical protein